MKPSGLLLVKISVHDDPSAAITGVRLMYHVWPAVISVPATGCPPGWLKTGVLQITERSWKPEGIAGPEKKSPQVVETVVSPWRRSPVPGHGCIEIDGPRVGAIRDTITEINYIYSVTVDANSFNITVADIVRAAEDRDGHGKVVRLRIARHRLGV
jgi:hypothetical protein